MAATPQYGQFIFVGMRSGRTYQVDTYISDVDNALINFDQGNGASTTSPTRYRPPEPVRLIDFSFHTGTADTEKIQLMVNGQSIGSILRYAQHLDTLARRAPLAISLPYGVDFQAVQISD